MGLVVLGIVLLIALLLFFFLVLPGFALVRDYQVGILTKKMLGKKMPEGQIIARNGEIGVQAWTLMPGLYWRFPIFWTISKGPVTVIEPSEIGIVESVDGNPLEPNRLLGDEVEANSFQDARMYLNNGGRKGPQVGILRPGTYRINTRVFQVTVEPVTVIEKDQVGVVVALDGRPLPNGYIIAPAPGKADKFDHQYYQNGQAFINGEGYRGPQLDTLQPGQYYINPLLFKVEVFPVAEVAPGYVAILRSNVGIELVSETRIPSPSAPGASLDQPVHEEAERLLIPTKDRRGIWSEPIAPGKYNLNPIAFTPYLVPTSAVTIDWARGTEIRTDIVRSDTRDLKQRTLPDKPPQIDLDSRQESIKTSEFFKFSQLRVTSKDGFQLEVDVRMVIRIKPENAAFIIARFGSVNNLIEQIVHPLIDSSFRNKAGEEKAMAFIQSRTQLQKDALERAKDEFNKYNVEAQNLLIAYINVDKALLDTQTNKEIALQQQEQYREQAKAQEENIAVKEKEARAAKQSDVIAAKLSVDIDANNASATIKKAEGERESVKILADGNAYSIKAIAEANAYKSKIEGEGIAQAYKAQTDVIGSNNVFLTKLMQEIADGKIQITPQILVAGGENGLNGNLINAIIAKSMLPNEEKKQG